MVKFHLDRDNWNISYGYFESFVGIFFDLTQTCLSPAFKIQHEVLTQWIERFLLLSNPNLRIWQMFKLYLLPLFKRYVISTIWKIKTLILSCHRLYTPPYIHPHAPSTILRLRQIYPTCNHYTTNIPVRCLLIISYLPQTKHHHFLFI